MSKKKEPQMKMGLKYSGNILNRIKYRLLKISAFLDQFKFWRSPLLWFDIFINAAATTYSTTWIYSNWDKLPDEITFFYYFSNESKRFISLTDVINTIFIYLFIQLVSVILAYKISSRFRPLATFLLVCIAITSVTFFISLYKSLSLVVA